MPFARPAPSPWPLRGLLVLGREVGVTEGHVERLVPHQLAHRVQVHSCHDQVRGESVPQVVEAKVADAGDLQGSAERALHVVEAPGER